MSEQHTPTDKVDQACIPFLRKFILEEYHHLSPTDPRTQKQVFYNTGEIRFTYPETKQMSLDVYQAEFFTMRDQLETADVPPVVKALYQAKFAEQQKIIDIIKATTTEDDEAFFEASSSLYGVPDPKLFWFTTKQINKRFVALIAKVDSKRKTLHKAYRVWREYFESLSEPANMGVYHVPMFSGIYVSNDYIVDSAEKIHQVFTDYLLEQNITNWTVKIDHPGERTSFGVNQNTKVISIPHDSDLSLRKKELTKVTLTALMHHEVGVHVKRRENGDASSLALLGIGLNDYLRAEEGLATLAEQLITGANNYAGEIGYFSIGAAIGTLGKPLSFLELYNLLHSYHILSIADRQLEVDGFYELDELRMMATDHAWNRSLRVYRGTTGNTPGKVYTRDIIYLEGNKQMWKLLDSEASIHPDWLAGKYDPSNTTHIAALTELGIL